MAGPSRSYASPPFALFSRYLLKWYVRDGDEFAEEVAQGATASVERLNSSTETQLKQHASTLAATCPFSGMAKSMQGLQVGSGPE
ncbi:unnamed protein product [Parascedosporium putredinis]|uniref:Uncharacterized protein n=1 Tax=Parascedosporium putredinis TaxID=1442378 RepID=A0A9P1GV15_9PEZI|nr:unnamed protein product [Parascedosporium putredinis]CAI7987858.1 unnamed protein product [Parascedosporium putredinis]